MIRYSLKCADGHAFESWFQSAEAFDKLLSAGHVSCAVCGQGNVEKSIMAPRVRPSRDAANAPARPDLKAPASEAEQALAKMRKHVEDNAEYVGKEFASKARAMHDGDQPERAIYGEARLDEAKKLVEDGIPVAPLPFRPQRKTN